MKKKTEFVKLAYIPNITYMNIYVPKIKYIYIKKL